MSQDAVSTPEAKGGGSAAAQAYRAEMAQESAGKDQAEVTESKPQLEARAAVRRKFSGRVRLTFEAGAATDARVIDMSTTGICLLVDQMVRANTTCTLACNIFHEGKPFVFGLRALAIYSVLASGKGFKVGLQFGPHDAKVATQIATLMR